MKDYQRGQVLLIVVLVMVTALTVGLSVAARSITNLRTSQDAENSEKAFSAAEAGIEQSMTSNSPVSGVFPNQASYQTIVRNVSGVEFPLNNGSPILKDDSLDIWLSTYPTYASPWTGTLTLYWGQAGDTCANSEATNTMSALEVILLTGTAANPKSTRYALDSCNARSLSNTFEFVPKVGGIVSGKTYAFKKTIPVVSGLFLRVIPLYSSAVIAVKGCDGANNNCLALPTQGTVVEAVGTSDKSQRKLVSSRTYPKLPTEIFPYSFFAPQ